MNISFLIWLNHFDWLCQVDFWLFIHVLCCRLNFAKHRYELSLRCEKLLGLHWACYYCNYDISESLRSRDSCLLLFSGSLIVASWDQSGPPYDEERRYIRWVAVSLTPRQTSGDKASLLIPVLTQRPSKFYQPVKLWNKFQMLMSKLLHLFVNLKHQ